MLATLSVFATTTGCAVMVTLRVALRPLESVTFSCAV